jgi:protein TonB
MKLHLPQRAIPLIHVALLLAAGAWLNYGTPASGPAAPVVPPVKIAPEPILAPPPVPAKLPPTVLEVPMSCEVAPLPPASAAPIPKPVAEPVEKPQPNCQPSACQYYYRRGFLRRQ